MPSKSKKILIADTSATSRALLSKAINNLGLEVEVLSDEDKAWMAFQRSEYCMVISNAKYMKLLKQVRAMNPEIPFIMMVAVYPEKLAQKIAPYNASCLPKPLLLENMERYINEYLGEMSESRAA